MWFLYPQKPGHDSPIHSHPGNGSSPIQTSPNHGGRLGQRGKLRSCWTIAPSTPERSRSCAKSDGPGWLFGRMQRSRVSFLAGSAFSSLKGHQSKRTIWGGRHFWFSTYGGQAMCNKGWLPVCVVFWGGLGANNKCRKLVGSAFFVLVGRFGHDFAL